MSAPPGETREITRTEAEDFLYREAELLDGTRLWEWLELFTDDAIYWIPENTEDLDPARETSILYDDRPRMEDRVWRLLHGPAHAQIPPSKTQHLISNVRVEEGGEEGVRLYSSFALFEIRRGEQRTFAGRCEHDLRLEGGVWKIARKKAVLINNSSPIYNLTFMV